MRRQGGGLGFVMILFAMAVILFIASRSWKAIAPTALEIQKKNRTAKAAPTDAPEDFEPPPSTSASGDAWNPTPPARPSLSGMEKRASEHTDAVRDALDQAQ